MSRKKLLSTLSFVVFVILVIVRAGTSPSSGSAIVFAPSGSLSLITEPEAGITPVLEKINNAKTSIDLVMYQLEDTQIEQALVSAKARGVAVRVLLNAGYYSKKEGDNAEAYVYLATHGVSVHWTPTYFALTHQKTLVIDGNDALIMTFNFTPQYYKSGREFAIDDRSANDVLAIEKIFDADWQGSDASIPSGTDLVWSPGSRDALLQLIDNATSTIEIYNEEMADPAITTALEDAAKRGVNVEVCMTNSASWKNAFHDLVQSGVHVRAYSASAKLYIHAKVILVDDSVAFVGSENFSPTSLDNNRELGIILNAPAAISSLNTTFQNDWQNARITEF